MNMKGIHLQYNMIYAASCIGTFYGSTNIDILNDQTNELMDKCPWLDEATVRRWLCTPHTNLISDPDHFDETLEAIKGVSGLEVTVFDLPEAVEKSYRKWAADGKPGVRGVMDNKGVITK